MFEIEFSDDGSIRCTGRLDAAQCVKGQAFMDTIEGNSILDFDKLDYISSAGLGILLKTQKRLAEKSAALKIINVNKHIHDVFHYSGFHSIFDISAKKE